MRIAMAVNCLVTEARRNLVWGVLGIFCSRSAYPYPRPRSTSPFSATRTEPVNVPPSAIWLSNASSRVITSGSIITPEGTGVAEDNWDFENGEQATRTRASRIPHAIKRRIEKLQQIDTFWLCAAT